MENVIEVKDVSKKFKVYFDKGQSLKERALFWKRNRYEERWALKGISFHVEKGKVLGLIGQNGCGKSTMLKLMSRIMYPDEGSIAIRGRVSSLIELGAGFHPDMSGRENIYINASIFGLTKKEIDDRLGEIIAFSELEKSIDNPVRTYSSGMYMRLAFSVAINVDADVLLIDEILAVGDANFQKKCFNRLEDLKREGITIVLVTHDMNIVEKFCDECVWLEGGAIRKYGPSREAVNSYLHFMNDKMEEESQSESRVKEEKKPAPAPQEQDENRWGSRQAEITGAYFGNAAGERTDVLRSGEPFSLNIEYKIHEELPEYVFGMGFYDKDKSQKAYFATNTQLDNLVVEGLQKEGVVVMDSPRMNLQPGQYYLQTAVVDKYGKPLDYFKIYGEFEVVGEDRAQGSVSFQRSWRTK